MHSAKPALTNLPTLYNSFTAEKLVISKFGIEKWHEVKEKAGCRVEDGGFIRHELFSDESTVALVVAASEVLGIPVDGILEAFGVYFMEFTRAEGFENLLNCQGSTLRTWLSNINALHDHLESSFPKGFIKPVFWCEDDAEVEGSIVLHYFSRRGNLLVPIVHGLVKEVARFHFNIAITMAQLQKQDVDGATFSSFRISAVDDSERWKITERENGVDGLSLFDNEDIPSGGRCPFSGAVIAGPGNDKTDNEFNSSTPTSDTSIGISGDHMKHLFPFHVCVDKNFVILQVGKSLASLMNVEESVLIGKKLSDALEITCGSLQTRPSL
jgi:Haem-NO-binding/Heme NO binding associated